MNIVLLCIDFHGRSVSETLMESLVVAEPEILFESFDEIRYSHCLITSRSMNRRLPGKRLQLYPALLQSPSFVLDSFLL